MTPEYNWKITWHYGKGNEERIRLCAADSEEEARRDTEMKLQRHKGSFIIKVEPV